MESLLLMVTNPEKLEKGTLPWHVFNLDGGLVGCDKSCDWFVSDYENSIESNHFVIEYYGGDYCIIPLKDDIYINKSHHPLSINSIVRLKTGDFFSIGHYNIRIEYFDQEVMPDSLFSKDLLGILGEDKELLLTFHDVSSFLESKEGVRGELLTIRKENIELDPIKMINCREGDSIWNIKDAKKLIPEGNLSTHEVLSDANKFVGINVENSSVSQSASPNKISKNRKDVLETEEVLMTSSESPEELDPLKLLGKSNDKN